MQALADAYTVPSSSSSSCPMPLAFSASSRGVPRSFKITYRLASTSRSTAVTNAVVRFGLPTISGSYKIKYAAFPTKRGLQLAKVGNSAAYWLNVAVPPKRKRTFAIHVKVAVCQTASLRFEIMTYLVTANGTSYCPSGARTVEVAVSPKYALGSRKHPCVTPSPTPAPAGPFHLYAEGERCLEGRLAPFSNGRRLQLEEEKRALEVAATDTIATPYECWYYCSVFGGVPAPFYFNWQATTSQCYCCGSTCTRVYDPGFVVYKVTEAAPIVPTVEPTRVPTVAPTMAPSMAPSAMPTFTPTAAPTKACVPGEYRTNNGTGPCAFCPAGTYWNSTQETTACLDCPVNQTSLLGATTCYTPCEVGYALNTTDLVCVLVPQSLDAALQESGVVLNPNTTETFIVSLPDRLEAVVGAVGNQTNTSIVVGLGSGFYEQTTEPEINADFILVADTDLTLQDPFFGRRWRHRQLQTTAQDPIIVAAPGLRHYIVGAVRMVTNGIIFLGSPASTYSGGLELQGTRANLLNTTFADCRTSGYGGAIKMLSGTICAVGTGSVLTRNHADLAGGAIYAGVGSRLAVNNSVVFRNNSAPRTATGGGGGAIYLEGAPAFFGSNVIFTGSNEDDITSAGGNVSCLNPALTTGVVNCTRCVGSYVIPPTCLLCSPSSPATECTTCPKASYGGPTAELSCQLCPYRYTTVYPPSALSESACVPITDPPTFTPTARPTQTPTQSPSRSPTVAPTRSPTVTPTQLPTTTPTQSPSQAPTRPPTMLPTVPGATFPPSQAPTTGQPTTTPTQAPSTAPTLVPSQAPSNAPTTGPSEAPSLSPTQSPSQSPTYLPTAAPTCCPVPPTAAPTTAIYPQARDVTATTLNVDSPPPSDVWNSERDSYNDLQSIAPAPPANATCALRQQTLADPTRATAGIYWDGGMFNGMLFKDFVLGGFNLSYSYYVDSTPAGQQLVYAPDIRIQTTSPGTGRYSDFVWNPYYNQDSQGPMVYQQWKANAINQTTGSSGSWPSGSTGGSGWSCTMGCYFPVNATEAHNLTSPASVASSTFRSLQTYVNGLLNQAQCSEPSCAINDAIITGIQVVLGPDEPTSVAYTQNVKVSSGAYAWSWTFGCGSRRQLREEGRRNWGFSKPGQIDT